MRRALKNHRSKVQPPRTRSYQPTVEPLEERLPPGDVLLGGMLGRTWLTSAVTGLAAESVQGLGGQAERRVVDVQQTPYPSFNVAPASGSGSSLFLAAPTDQAPDGTMGSAANPARPANSAPTAVQPAFRDASGLTDETLDQLLGDDFDQLSSPAKQHGIRSETSGLTGGSENPAPAPTGAGGAVGGASSTLGEGMGALTTPSMPDAPNGGLTGGGGAASAQGPSGSLSSGPNLISDAHFANHSPATGLPARTTGALGGSHGTIRPFTSVAWPSDTPPTSGSSGGGPPVDTVNSSSGGSNGGASGGINNSNNGSSGGQPSGGGPSTGQPSGGGPSASSGGSGGSGGCNCGCGSAGTSGGSGGANSGGITSGAPDFMIEERPGATDHSLASPSVYSPAGVRYFDGQINITSTDLSTGGFGSFWNQTRSWGNGTPPSSNNGNGWIDMDRPYVLNPNGDNSEIIVVSSATDARFFNLVNGSYAPQFFLQDQLVHNTSTGEFVFTDTMSDTIHFFDFSGSNANQWGQFKSCTDPMGNTISVTSWTSNGSVAEMQRSDGTTTQSYLFTYLAAPDPNAGEIANITLRQKVGSGSWTIVRQVNYDYYDGTQNKPYGNLGDLRSATTLDGNNNIIDTTSYRYYTPSDAGSIGYVHGLKYVFSPQSYARMAADLANPLTATDSQVAPYADAYYQYDPTSQRVTKAVVQGSGCSVCTGGQGTFTYSYGTSSFDPGYNNWATVTYETLPDGSTNTVYANYAGETMLDAFSSGGQQWINYYRYDSDNETGRLILQANPSAVTGWSIADPDLIGWEGLNVYAYLRSQSGLIQLTDYYKTTTATETTAGSVLGYFEDSKLEQGSQGTPILQQTVQYYAHSAGGMTVYPQATSTVYRNTDDTGAETTSYAYTWYSGTAQKQSMTVTEPVVSAAENGPGVADVWTYSYDPFERVTQVADPDGYLTTYQYDQATGAQTQSVIDSGGSGHLNLTTTTLVDALGRPVKVTDPNGNITYTVYNDANHEVRVYPGWNGTTTTGPTQVTREDRSHDPSFTETFTMSATPHLTNGVPDGTEPYAYLQSLSRTITSKGGQVQETDQYFNLGGVPYSTTTYLGTAGTNYYATLYTYDDPRGWQDRVQDPTGTITRTVYDVLGRVVSTWVGTNDTPASGSWSPTNNTAPSNMVQVTGNVWDGGGIGDSTLTQVTQYPGGSAAARVTQNFYDWRDRLLASKQGVQANENDGTHRPILYYTLDNLGEVTTSQRYDGDGVTTLPTPPSATALRAQTTTAYDDQGRVYQTNVYSVDQSSGTVSANSLTTNTWYNHRGLVIKTSPPAAASTKTSYDGAGRATVVYTTDAYGDSTWSDATTVSSSNNVLTQTENTYDNDGNIVLQTTRDRFDTETQGGPLGNPTTHPYARVSYVANYYDAANRLTDSANVGTNGGSSYTRPGSVPARSDTVLVTSSGYKADTVQQVMLTGSPTGGLFTLNFAGQGTYHMAYNASAATVQADLQALPNIGSGNVLVSGPAGGPWQVRFAGALAGLPEPELTGNGSALTGGTNPGVAIGTTSQGGDTGRVQSTTDPRGLLSKTDHDLLGRTVRTIQNFVAFAPSNSADQTTQYTYDGSNHILTLSAVLPGSVLETTTYTYGVSGSILSSNDLLASVAYPGETQTDSYSYDALGETLTHTDRNGNAHTFTYDILGRQTADAVTTLGSGVDGSVRMLTTAYDTGGRPYLYTSYADTAGTTMVNQVEDLYNGLGQLITEYQSHSGAVNASTTPNVQYAYSFVATSGGPNHSRLVSMTYPNGRVLNYTYNSGVDDRISRLSSISDSSGTLEAYSYLGLHTIVTRSHSQTGINQSSVIPGGNPDGGDQYTGLDRFGRVVEQKWFNPNTGTVTDDFLYSYDRDGNRLTASNALDTALSQQFTYDNLNQLASFTQGSHTQSWSLDSVGNWLSFTNDGSTQTRSFNTQNQLTSISGATTPSYDANGNTLTDDNGTLYTLDGWNRIVKAVVGGTTMSYSYDALGRRVTTARSPHGPVDAYFSSNWQVLEQDQQGLLQQQFVWSSAYVDGLVEQDSGSSRWYADQDANWNVTAMLNSNGTVANRFVYDPYGKGNQYDANWNLQGPIGNGTWFYFFQGGRLDATTGLYNFRNRDYSTSLGRWMQEDPTGYDLGGLSLYGYEGNEPVINRDPFGTSVPGACGCLRGTTIRGELEEAIATVNIEQIKFLLNLMAETGCLVVGADLLYKAQRLVDLAKDLKCCVYRCSDGLPYYHQVIKRLKCPLAFVFPWPRLTCNLNLTRPGPCPPNIPRPGGN